MTILGATYAVQLTSLSGLYLFKKLYIKKKFSDMKTDDSFVNYVEDSRQIEKSELKYATAWSFVPGVGFLNIYLLYLLYADEIARYFKVSDGWEGIQIIKLFDDLTTEFKRLRYKDNKPIELALELVKNNDYKQIVISSSELLLKTLKTIKHNSNKETSTEINKTISDYTDLLKTVADTPEQLDITTLDNTRNIFNSVKDDLKNKKGVY